MNESCCIFFFPCYPKIDLIFFLFYNNYVFCFLKCTYLYVWDYKLVLGYKVLYTNKIIIKNQLYILNILVHYRLVLLWLTDVAFEILAKEPNLAYSVNEVGITPLHLLASKPSVFRSGSHLGWWKSIIYHCKYYSIA